jgi:peptidoglycan/xylan/chitin deacetylase (PgdA/CDA1 family)
VVTSQEFLRSKERKIFRNGGAIKGQRPMHIISLSFDDGFERSNLRIAEIYERFGLFACFNVLAFEEVDGEKVDDVYHDFPKGNFKLWNELQKRGHEIMPHGLIHHNLARMPLADAQRSITRCLAVFTQELENFQAKEAVYNFAYNASTPEIEAWLPTIVKAFRTGGSAINPLPHTGQVRLTTSGYGPENCEWHLDEHIERLLAEPSGWLIYNTHGLDDEGWGPIRAEYLESLLERLSSTDGVAVMPVGNALSNNFDPIHRME